MENNEAQCLRSRNHVEDRISSLTDDVLLFIMSLLTLKEFGKTSILSSRWLNLWANKPVLDFHASFSNAIQISDEERQNHVKWVNHVLQRHKGHYLKQFKIVYGLDKDNQEDINRWLEFALTRKVESLELNFSRSDPRSMLSNYDLSDWFLKFAGGKANLDGGESHFLQFDLKCLKTLCLKSVDISGEAINLFLLNCPLLERLVVIGSLNLVNLVISDPSLALKYVQIKYCFFLKVLSISNFNLVSLDLHMVGDLTLTNLPMLVELSIAGTSDNISHSLSQASSFCSQLEAFTLRAYGPELIWNKPEQSKSYEFEQGSSSSNLISKSLKVFEFKGYYCRASDLELIVHVADNAPGLEKIIIDPRDVYLMTPHESRTQIEELARTIAL